MTQTSKVSPLALSEAEAQAILQNLPFTPTNPNLFRAGVYNAVSYNPAAAPASPTTETQLKSFVTTKMAQLYTAMNPSLSQATATSQAQATANLIDDPTIMQHIADVRLRAAFVMLKGTVADGAIDWLKSGAFDRIVFKDLDPSYKGLSVRYLSDGSKEIQINSRYANEDPRELAEIISHELLHQDTLDSVPEEAIAYMTDSAVYAQYVMADSTLPVEQTELTQRLNMELLARINDRDASTGNLHVISANGGNVYPGSAAPLASFNSAFSDTGSENMTTAPTTPGNSYLRSVILHMTGKDLGAGIGFNDYTRQIIDTHQTLFTLQQLLQIDVNLELNIPMPTQAIVMTAPVATSANQTLTGGTGNDSLVGSNGNDKLTGNAGNDTLAGGAGSDTLDGGAGNDSLFGGDGNDLYLLNPGFGHDTISDSSGTDTVQFGTNILASNTLFTADLGNDLMVSFKNSTDQLMIFKEFASSTGIETFKFADGTTYTTSQITSLLQTLGTTGDDYLYGSTLGEHMFGGAGNDTLYADAGNDTLDGGTGNNTLLGGTGNDTYIVNSVNDTVIEYANEGTDTVQSSITYTLGDNVENLILTGNAAINGTGNGLNNSLTGNSANNILTGGTGNDTFNGGGGIDTLVGGAGNDTYIVDSTTDTITENANEGTDLVQSSVTYTLGNNLENLTLTGTAAISGTGNGLNNVLTGNSANNVLTGGAGNDTLNGGAGTDTLIGGTGNDTYVVDSATDTIKENASEGTDLVDSSVTYTLGANLENLTLTGTAVINGTGNTLNNLLTGNSANNILNGGAGNDTLNGGAGIDTLIGGTGNDSYLFNKGDGLDTIQENDTTSGNIDHVVFNSAITKAEIAIFKNGSNLEIGYQGDSTDKIVVQSQFTSAGQVERFDLGTGQFMTNSDINLVIQNMTSYASAHGISMTSLSTVENNQNLLNIVAAGWHS